MYCKCNLFNCGPTGLWHYETEYITVFIFVSNNLRNIYSAKTSADLFFHLIPMNHSERSNECACSLLQC
jgi:hypothetical protein